MGPSSGCALLVCSLPPESAPAPREGHCSVCGSGSQGSRWDLAPFPQAGSEQGAMGPPSAGEEQGCPMARGAVCVRARVLVCVLATLALWGVVLEGMGQSPPSLSQGSLLTGAGTVRGPPAAYLSTAKQPSGPMLLLFLLICSFFLFEFCFLNQNQQEFIFLPAPRG